MQNFFLFWENPLPRSVENSQKALPKIINEHLLFLELKINSARRTANKNIPNSFQCFFMQIAFSFSFSESVEHLLGGNGPSGTFRWLTTQAQAMRYDTCVLLALSCFTPFAAFCRLDSLSMKIEVSMLKSQHSVANIYRRHSQETNKTAEKEEVWVLSFSLKAGWMMFFDIGRGTVPEIHFDDNDFFVADFCSLTSTFRHLLQELLEILTKFSLLSSLNNLSGFSLGCFALLAITRRVLNFLMQHTFRHSLTSLKPAVETIPMGNGDMMMAWQLYKPYLSWQTHLMCRFV